MKTKYWKMGLISDRRNKAKQPKNENSGVPKMKKGLFGGSTSHMFPLATPSSRGIPGVPKYPPGYYTTPVNHSSSWSHPGQPKYSANVNPRYQTWVAPRKQPALGQLVIYWFLLIKYIQDEGSDRSTLVSHTFTTKSHLSLIIWRFSHRKFCKIPFKIKHLMTKLVIRGTVSVSVFGEFRNRRQFPSIAAIYEF